VAKNALNRPVSSRDGTDLGVIADVTFRERLKEGLQAFHLEITIPWSI
jgi:uncharacterized protein YrrD